MCGIAGISASSNHKLNSSNLRQTVTELKHRGPDDFGIFEDAKMRIGLIHTRLSILDTSPLGHQPMWSKDKKYVMVFNGEIYNYRELRSELEANGHEFCGNSDTEVLLNLFANSSQKSEDILSILRKLNGIFSIALWDCENSNLFLARDALGVKPLYVYSHDGVVAFASEIKALKKLVPDFGEINASSIERYITYLWCPGSGTPVKRIQKLGPGEAMWIKNGSIQEKLEWFILPTLRAQVQNTVKTNDVITSLTQNLRKAVHRQMVSDVPVGAFLSGGLDSSSIVAFAKEIDPNIRCFTIGIDHNFDMKSEDLPFAQTVAKHLDINLEVVKVDSDLLINSFEKWLYQLDEPLADPASLNVLLISELARKRGIKVLLSGTGGDDLLSGYRRHHALLLSGYWSWVPDYAKLVFINLADKFNSNYTNLRRFKKFISNTDQDANMLILNYFRWTTRKDIFALCTENFKSELKNIIPEQPMLDFLELIPKSKSPLQKILALEQKYFLTDHNLNYTDKMSMAAGVEVRVPFLDLEFLEFSATIPDKYKYRGFKTKWVLKKAMEPYLPREVIYRSKTGFNLPLRQWMRCELREFISFYLTSDSLKNRGFFDPTAVMRLIKNNDSGEIDASYTLFSLLCIEMWCRLYLDK